MYYTVFIIFKERVIGKILPSEAEEYKANISAVTGTENCFITFMKINGVWHIADDDIISVTDGSALEDGATLEISVKKTSVTAAVSAYMINEESYGFDKYIPGEMTTEIGSREDADITADSDFVSRDHAVIVRENEGYIIKDLSRNGVYINGKRISGEKHLDMLDEIWISGLRIIFLGGVLAVGRSSHVRVKLEKAENIITEICSRKREQTIPDIINDSSSYDISPAVIPMPDLRTSDAGRRKISDIMKTSVPSAAVLSSAYAVMSGASVPVLAGMFAGITAVLSGGWIAASSVSDRANKKRTDNANSEMRKTYLEQCAAAIEKKRNDYCSYMDEKYMTAEKLIIMYREGKRVLRARGNDDFLKIRIGMTHEHPDYLSDIRDSADPDLIKLSQQLLSSVSVPAVLDFKKEKAFYITGNKDDIISVLSGVAVKISACHDSDDVKMMFFISPEFSDELEFVKWLPHVYSDDRTVRYVSEENCSSRVYSHLISLLRSGERKSEDRTAQYPRYVVFCTSDTVMNDETVKRYLRSEYDTGVTFVFVRISHDKEITVTGGCSVLRTEAPEKISSHSLLSYSRLFARFSDSDKKSVPVPEMISFLEMAGYENINQINLSGNYRKNKASEGIKAVIGCGKDESRFVLDIHESAQGPHGLMAGTTGSGKSEAIQTLILSLAVSYSPDEIAFVLIDYKGGGMSAMFENLPHTAGVLTNLSDSGSQVWRSLVSLRSEIKKRQTVFREHGVSHIDRYMDMFRAGNAELPMPHLIIICDEFAELKREQPEFISQLVSISRVGRSLGIHLILATQKPAGVVDDEIWSNSSFRICLKVQDRADSIGMLRRPEAADISVTGRAWVQAGSDEIFELIQTGYTGAEYVINRKKYEARMVLSDMSDAVCRIGKKSTGAVTQLQALTDYITGFCISENIKSADRLWNAPLPEMPFLSDVSDYGDTEYDDGLICTFGIADDPENQNMFPAVTDIYQCGNILAAGRAGSGKTTLVSTMICSLAEKYPKNKFRFSVIDLSGGLFSVYARLPHCERIMTSPDERELAEFMTQISDETERRKRIFSEAHAVDFSEYREFADDMEARIIFIDGYYLFRELYPSLEEMFTRISGDSAKYGIYFAVTVKQASDMRVRTRQNFHTVISLVLNDRTEYTELFGMRPETELAFNTGRGYIKQERRVLEFQTAVCCSGTGRERQRQLEQIFERIGSNENTEDIQKIQEYCSFVNVRNDCGYISLAGELSELSSVFIWSVTDIASGKEINNAECFCGSDGAYDLLVRLKDIFSERNTVMKISGRYEGEDITVLLCGLDDFCRCIYEDGRDDMSRITETFFRDGSGLGIRFISGKEDNAYFRNSEAYKIFSSYSKGGEDA